MVLKIYICFMSYERTVHNMHLDGGWLCLDFINTVHDRFATDPHEYLKTWDDFLSWGKKTRILNDNQAIVLKNISRQDAERSGKILKKAKKVREALYRLFLPVTRQQVPAPEVVAEFNTYLSPALSGLAIHFPHLNTVYPQQKNVSDLENPLHQVITSAYDLLLSGNLDRVKECNACGWLFLDKSKNSSKRWCNMQTCGSAAKAKRYYLKKKEKNEM